MVALVGLSGEKTNVEPKNTIPIAKKRNQARNLNRCRRFFFGERLFLFERFEIVGQRALGEASAVSAAFGLNGSFSFFILLQSLFLLCDNQTIEAKLRLGPLEKEREAFHER